MREKHWLVASYMYPYWGSNLHPRCVPWQGIELTTFWCIGRCFTNWGTRSGLCLCFGLIFSLRILTALFINFCCCCCWNPVSLLFPDLWICLSLPFSFFRNFLVLLSLVSEIVGEGLGLSHSWAGPPYRPFNSSLPSGTILQTFLSNCLNELKSNAPSPGGRPLLS